MKLARTLYTEDKQSVEQCVAWRLLVLSACLVTRKKMTTWDENAKNIMSGCECEIVVIAGNGGVPIAFCESDADDTTKPFGSPNPSELQELNTVVTARQGTSFTLFEKRFIVLNNDDSGLIGKSGKSSICVRKCKTIFIASVLRDDNGKFGKMRDAMERFATYYISVGM